MRILHLPTDTGGNAHGLSRGERLLGHSSDVLVAQASYLDYPADILLYNKLAGNRAQKLFRRLRYLQAFLRLRKAYDVFHFNFGTSLLHFPGFGLPGLELPFYDKKAKIAVTYNGCDARQKFPTMERNPHAPCHDPACYGGTCNSGRQDAIRAKAIDRMDAFANVIFALNPDLLYFLPERAVFLPYTIAGWDELIPAQSYEPSFPLRIVHAPTNRAAKGSDAVFAAVEILKKEQGDKIEFVLVENKTHKQALKIYAGADLVIDQLRLGWYGGLAVEVMKLGKPVVAYIREEDLHFLPSDMARDVLESFINATEETLLDTLRTLVENPEILRQKSRAALEYVHRRHDPVLVARQVTAAYENS
ncbi:hypothetical protein LJC15_00300 [Desulfovibrio sp. OttesenSCG-928-G11]|nr:hypothetical protein [Desulfovibrio sp. OttesenSCG-928-G11]